jgi:hypothetical protein
VILVINGCDDENRDGFRVRYVAKLIYADVKFVTNTPTARLTGLVTSFSFETFCFVQRFIILTPATSDLVKHAGYKNSNTEQLEK